MQTMIKDGVSFDFSSAETDIKNLLPAGNTITFIAIKPMH
jgi:hypothetical protein